MRTGSRILNVVLVGAFVAGAGVLFVPRLLGWQLVTVLTGSMTPTYPVESVLAVKPINPVEIRVGDVVTFMTAHIKAPVTHRVIAVHKTDRGLEFTTKGDANEDRDPDKVTSANIRGRVVFGIPVLGRVVRIVNSRAVLPLLLGVSGLVLLASQLRPSPRSRPSRLEPEGSAS